MTENRKVEDAGAKAPQELKPEELEKVAGGLGGDDLGLPQAKGVAASSSNNGGITGGRGDGVDMGGGSPTI